MDPYNVLCEPVFLRRWAILIQFGKRLLFHDIASRAFVLVIKNIRGCTLIARNALLKSYIIFLEMAALQHSAFGLTLLKDARDVYFCNSCAMDAGEIATAPFKHMVCDMCGLPFECTKISTRRIYADWTFVRWDTLLLEEVEFIQLAQRKRRNPEGIQIGNCFVPMTLGNSLREAYEVIYDASGWQAKVAQVPINLITVIGRPEWVARINQLAKFLNHATYPQFSSLYFNYCHSLSAYGFLNLYEGFIPSTIVAVMKLIMGELDEEVADFLGWHCIGTKDMRFIVHHKDAFVAQGEPIIPDLIAPVPEVAGWLLTEHQHAQFEKEFPPLTSPLNLTLEDNRPVERPPSPDPYNAQLNTPHECPTS